MTIPKLQIKNLKNSFHVNLIEFTVNATVKYPYISEILPEPVRVIKEAYDRENEAYLKSNRSFITKQVQEANSNRIVRFREVNSALNTAKLCTDKVKSEAAEFLLEIVRDYGGASKIMTSRVDALSGILTNLVEDFQERFPEKVEAAGIKDCLEELRQANEAYKALRSDRTEEVSEQVKKAMRDARDFSDTAWRGLVDVTNWRYFYKKDAKMLPFMRYMATEVDWYRTILGQKPGDVNANPDGGSEGEGSTTTPPTTEPETPPTGSEPETPPTQEPTEPGTTEPSEPGNTEPTNPPTQEPTNPGDNGNTDGDKVKVTFEYINGRTEVREYPKGTVLRPGDGNYPANTPGYSWSVFYHTLDHDWTATEYDNNDSGLD